MSVENDKPIMVGDLIETVEDYVVSGPTEVIAAWAHLSSVLVGLADLLDKKATEIIVCAWCKAPSATYEEVRDHISQCRARPRENVGSNDQQSGETDE